MTEAMAVGAADMEALRSCVHCGICLPQCPTYRVLGQEMDSPRGRVYLMRAAAEGRIGLTPGLARHLDLCLGCRGCETACPSGVPFGRLLEATRGQLERHGVRAPQSDHTTRRWALETFPYPARLAPLLWGLRLYQASGLQALVRGSLRRSVPPRASGAVTLPQRLAGLSGGERGRLLLELVCAEAAAVLGGTASAIEPAHVRDSQVA